HDLTVPPGIYMVEPESEPQDDRPDFVIPSAVPPQFLARSRPATHSSPPIVLASAVQSQPSKVLRSAPQASPVAPVPPVVAVPTVQPSLAASVPTMVTSTNPSPPILRSRTTPVSSPVQEQEGGGNTEQSLLLRSGRFSHRRYPQQSQPQASTNEL